MEGREEVAGGVCLSGVSESGRVGRQGRTYDLNDLDGMFPANGDEVCRVVVVAGAEGVDEGGVGVLEVHSRISYFGLLSCL